MSKKQESDIQLELHSKLSKPSLKMR